MDWPSVLVKASAWGSLAFLILGNIPVAATGRVYGGWFSSEGITKYVITGFLLLVAYPDDRRIVAVVCMLGILFAEALTSRMTARELSVEAIVLKVLAATGGLMAGGLIMAVLGH